MELKCKCGNVVLKGEIEIHIRQSKTGKMLSHTKKAFVPEGKPQGIIIKNHSQQPEKWTAICTSCQRMDMGK